jgi:hypothetical protein
MKHLLWYGIGVLFLISACKKDEDDAPKQMGDTANYYLVAPACLATHIQGSFGKIDLSYDNQKRLIRLYRDLDSSTTTFTYLTNTIIETTVYRYGNGDSNTVQALHHLNANGFIDSTSYSDRNTITLYTYTKQGYLIRRLFRNVEGLIYSGQRYEYSGGDLTQVYELNINPSTGETKDGELLYTYEYYSTRGTISGFNSWIHRTGRGNTHELKAEHYQYQISTYTYSWDSNGLPTRLTYTPPSEVPYTSSFTWICY